MALRLLQVNSSILYGIVLYYLVGTDINLLAPVSSIVGVKGSQMLKHEHIFIDGIEGEGLDWREKMVPRLGKIWKVHLIKTFERSASRWGGAGVSTGTPWEDHVLILLG